MIVRHLLVGIALAALVVPAVAKDAREETKVAQDSGFAFDNDQPSATGGRRARSRSARRAAGEQPFDPNADGVSVITDGSDASEPVHRARRRPSLIHSSAQTATILPPARPSDDVAVAAPLADPVTPAVQVAIAAPVTAVAATTSVAATSVAATPSTFAAAVAPLPVIPDASPQGEQHTVFVLPPMRPSLPEAVMADDADGTIGRRVKISVYPPARPGFASDDAPVDEAAFTPVSVEGSGTISIVRVLPPDRPAFPWDEPMQTASLPETTPAQPVKSLFGALFASVPTLPSLGLPSLPGLSGSGHNGIDGMITRHAKLNDVPEALVHRVVIRESKYNPRAIGQGGALGLMQIKHATARSLGYDGSPMGLLDADTNLTYAVKYLAGAYRTAGGDFDQAVRYYARGYYYAAKAANNRGIALASYRGGRRHRVQEADAAAGQDAATVLASAPVERTASVK